MAIFLITLTCLFALGGAAALFGWWIGSKFPLDDDDDDWGPKHPYRDLMF